MSFLVLLIIGIIFGAVLSSALRENSKIPLSAVIGGILLIVLVLGTVRVVPAGYVGIVDLFGHVSDKALSSGIQFVNPLARVVPMSVRTQELMEEMPVPSREGLTIKLDLSILFKLDPPQAVQMYKTVGPYYQEIVIIPQFRAAARGVTVGHDAKALYTSEREVLAQTIFDSLKSMVEDRGITLERVLLRGMQLPPTVSGAIEQKLKAEQESERMKFILQRETQEAERKRVEAAGIRDAQTIINQSLTSQYLQYLWISTVNQNPNVMYVATEANMPMFRAVSADDELLRKKPITAAKEQK